MDYFIHIDLKRCSGCQACVVACMDENDLDPERGDIPWRQVFQVEEGKHPESLVSYVPLACTHCSEAFCIAACPTGAMHMRENGIVAVNVATCIGCRMCLIVCPFGAPRFGRDGKIQKCTMCAERVEAGLEPACVRTCPTRALWFGPVNEVASEVQARSAEKLARLGTTPTRLP
jgi:anaerobic dimethyl sulfoxide reductase subunit B